MTVPVQDTINSHVGNGVSTAFAYNFYLLDAGDLYVTVDGALITSGYSVSGVGVTSGGYVTFNAAPASNASIVLERIVSLERQTDYQQNGDFLAAVVNKDFDRIWMALQQGDIGTSAAVRIPREESASGINTLLPSASSRASKALVFDGSGNVVVSADDYNDQLANVTAQAQAAQTSANQSATSASQALASANSAADSANNAATSASNADSSASQAATSASDASQSATSALASANSAAASAATMLAGVRSVNASGTGDAIVAHFSPEVTALEDRLIVYVKVPSANTSTSPTLQADSTAAIPIQKDNGASLSAGELNGQHLFMYDSSLSKWVLLNPSESAQIAEFKTAFDNQNTYNATTTTDIQNLKATDAAQSEVNSNFSNALNSLSSQIAGINSGVGLDVGASGLGMFVTAAPFTGSSGTFSCTPGMTFAGSQLATYLMHPTGNEMGPVITRTNLSLSGTWRYIGSATYTIYQSSLSYNYLLPFQRIA